MIYMASTKITEGQTIGEIMDLLARHHVSGIMTQYDQGEVIGLMFGITHKGNELYFRLPVRWEPVLAAMESDRQTPNTFCNPKQARKVAWRQILRWVEAQLTLAEIGMADIKEVFLPYLLVAEGETIYQRLENEKFPTLKGLKDNFRIER